MANIIQDIQKPTLIVAHNKTLAAQLALEFKEFFPENAVHYFVSYYDYYQPEAYVGKTDTYIEKEATVNAEIDRLRHAATQDLIKRKDVIIVASVSCIYGVGDISAYEDSVFEIEVWAQYPIEELLKKCLLLQYKRAWTDFKPWTFQVMGDLLEIFPASQETVYSIEFWGDEVSQITRRNYLTGDIYEYLNSVEIFPAKHTVTSKDTINSIIPLIQEELKERLEFFEATAEVVKHERLKTKVEYDIEMLQEVGYVNGIENYSRYLDGRKEGAPPATLIDYFWDDFLCFIDESHMTISQIWGMYAWDRARKENLVNAWFRLPSALDNRPLKFAEFEGKIPTMVLVSATPWPYDIEKSSNNPEVFYNFDATKGEVWKDTPQMRIVPQVIRPTWLLDPMIELRSMEYLVDDIMKHISEIQDLWEKMLITTLTKRSSEELTDYLLENGVKVKYLHSEVETLDRLEILKDLRTGKIDVIVWVNLLREGLDLPEVTKIAILDADKQGFLRSPSALIQIVGRAARNSKGTVFMYCEQLHWAILEGDHLLSKKWEIFPHASSLIDEYNQKTPLYEFNNGKFLTQEGLFVSKAMRMAINLTNYRRRIQTAYNLKHGITPTTILSDIKDIGIQSKKKDYALIDEATATKELTRLEFEMNVASANMEYEKAAELRDLIIELRKAKKK